MSLLTMNGITKVFPGVRANDNVSFDLKRGEIHALVGENGAGKTTLMKILYGLYKPDSGSISIKDNPIIIENPKHAIQNGIGMVHQHFMLVSIFNAVENIILGEETNTAGYLQYEKPKEEILSLMKKNQMEININTKVEDLPVGVQQRIEILKILYRGAEILVFDEPTAVLTPQEVRDLFETFKQLKEQGKGIIFISHKLDEVLTIADRITVIRQGIIVETLQKEKATKAKLAELMVGKPVLFDIKKTEPKIGKEVLHVKNVNMYSEGGTKTLSDIGFNVHEGEIYGIAGVEGNGQSELIRAIASDGEIKSGIINLLGRDITTLDIRQRRDLGISHIPEDRNRYGLLQSFTISENICLGRHHLPPYVNKLQVMQKDKIQEKARQLIEDYDIRTPSELAVASSLSGGNQQKVIVAREMDSNPALLIASQPTRGVDIGAMEFIYKQLLFARSEGRAVLLVSADLDEILTLSDRIGVIYKGKIIKEFNSSEATKEKVGFYMMGEKQHDTDNI